MKYSDAIKQETENLAKDEKVKFIGYNIAHGSKAYGTLKDVDSKNIIETPTAENLMTGLAIGMALEGFKPVLFFERHDFMLVALDALANHLDMIERLSRGEFKVSVIVRAVVGATKPLYPGLQHMQDFTEIFKKIFKFKVIEVKNIQDIKKAYTEAAGFDESVMIIERKDLYGEEFN